MWQPTSSKQFQSWLVNHLVVPIGYHTFLHDHKKYNQGSGKKRTKNRRTIWAWVNSSARRASLWHCISCASADQRWRASFAKFPQNHEECWLILTGLLSLLLDPISCRLVSSAVQCRLRTASPFANSSLWDPSSNSSLWRSRAHFRSRRDLELRPLFGFVPKQTKGSSA